MSNTTPFGPPPDAGSDGTWEPGSAPPPAGMPPLAWSHAGSPPPPPPPMGPTAPWGQDSLPPPPPGAGWASPYGSPAPYPGYPTYYGAMPANGLATAALTLGIIGLCLFWMPVIGAFLAVLGVVFGLLGMTRAKAMPGRPLYGRALAGLITGAVGCVFGIGFTMAVLSATNDLYSEINSDPIDGICNEQRYLQDPDCG